MDDHLYGVGQTRLHPDAGLATGPEPVLNINTMTVEMLTKAGVTAVMADAIEQARKERLFESAADACRRCDRADWHNLRCCGQ